MEQKANKKGMVPVILLAIAILLSVIVLTVAIASMIKENGSVTPDEDTSLYSLSGVTNVTNQDSQANGVDFDESQEGLPNITEEKTEETKGVVATVGATVDAAVESTVKAEQTENEVIAPVPDSDDDVVDEQVDDVQTQATTKKNNDAYDPVDEYEKLSKNGDNQLSDHHNNKYIKLISEKYNVDTELLVAIYSEPDKGSNFVLEFNGKRDEDGNVVKSPETLSKVYQIDKNKNVVIATGKNTGNVGVSYAEGALCFNIVKTIVMPQYPEYFTGVEK